MPGCCEGHVRRMLADPRSVALMIDNFVGQWLLLRNIPSVTPDPNIFPTFDENLRDAFRRESELFVEQRHAGGRQPRRPPRRRLHVRQRAARRPLRHPRRLRQPVPQGAPRRPAGGAACWGTAGLLTVTSYPNRTSPVLQGQVGAREPARRTAPAPAPARRAVVPRAGTRAARRRRSASCSRCTARVPRAPAATRRWTPWGSRWRTSTPSAELAGDGRARGQSTPRGAMPTGDAFDGPSTACAALLVERSRADGAHRHREAARLCAGPRLSSTTTTRLFSKIARDAAADGHRWSAVVLGIVQSPPFQLRSIRLDDHAAR